MGTFSMYLASLLLSLTTSVGFSPLRITTRITLDPHFAAGTVCLLWDSTEDAATPGSDCWTIESSRQRTWVKEITLRTGVYGVWATQVGQDDAGNAMKMTSPLRRVEVY